jgi:hypothetical protein
MRKTLILALLVVVTLTSCYRSGYGCRGNSRIMTRVQ